MPTLLYAPGVRIYIKTEKYGLIDVSDDCSSGTMVRRSDGISTLGFSLNNPRRRYDSTFTPNDRVVVVMKRVTWLRTFTGLLNSVPLVSVWPRDVNLQASCSLKRLQYWYWDPYAPATQSMINMALADSSRGTGANTNSDGGITNVILTILDKVVKWPSHKVHIGRIPDDWYKIAMKMAAEVNQDALKSDEVTQAYLATLGAGGVIAGDSGANPGGSFGGTSAPLLLKGKLQPGSYGGTSLDATQVGYAQTIYQVAKGMGLSDRDALLGIMCAMQESTLRNLKGGDRDSVGLFQQRPSQGWGTIAQCTNPQYAATKFYEGLRKISRRDSMSETQAIQAVQRSGFPDAYQRWLGMGKAVMSSLKSIPPSNAPSSGPPAPTPSTTTGIGSQPVNGQPTGVQFAEKAQAMTLASKIVYQEGGTPRTATYAAQMPTPPMDCSLFVSAVYLKVVGNYAFPPQTESQHEWLAAHGGRRISAEQGMHTPGALMYIVGNRTHHVEISMGDGKHTCGAHRPGVFAGVVQAPSINYYDEAYLLPGVYYTTGGSVPIIGGSGDASGGGTTAATSAPLTVPFSQTPGYNPADPFDKLFGDVPWRPQMDTEQGKFAASLVGSKALMNDQPILQYLKNLFYSTLRSFCSAPNGDLIAWFPDYYGLWGTAAKMAIEPIELRDFTVDWSDDSLVTHMFTAVSRILPEFDLGSGTFSDAGITVADGQGGAIAPQLLTRGIASIDMGTMMQALFGIDATPEETTRFANYIYERFGARPDYEEMPGLLGPGAELFSAIFKFMFYWAYQYSADVEMTFMPELWPGMLIQLKEYDFQAYVTTVTHSWNMADGGGFNTVVNICAPARLGDKTGVLLGLPEAGDFRASKPKTKLGSQKKAVKK